MSNEKLIDQLKQLKEFCSRCEIELKAFTKYALENDGIISFAENKYIESLQSEIAAIKKRIADIEKAKGISSTISDTLSSVVQTASNAVSTAIETVTQTVQSVVESVEDKLSAPSNSISGSVGKNASNQPNDVIWVKIQLNKLNNAGLTETNTNCGDKTIQSIINYQKGMQFDATGIIQPGDNTAKALESNKKPGLAATEKGLIYEDKAIAKNGKAFVDKVKTICNNIKMKPDYMMATMYMESKFDAAAQNPKSQATGLIQFMPTTAKGLGTSIEALKSMKAIDQLDYVEKYYKQFGTLVTKIKEPAESYLLVFYPAAIGKGDDYVLGSEKSDDYARKVAEQNKIYDVNKNGFITKGEVLQYQREHHYKEVYLNLSNANASETPAPTASSGPLSKPNWISIAEKEIGVKEKAGAEHNPKVIEYHATTGKFKDDETPWCSSFVNWVMNKSGNGGTNSAQAISWAKWGKKINKPAYGAIAVIDWDGSGPGTKGHVGFVVGKKGSSIELLGGNQSNAVNVSTFSSSKVIAYVFPSNFQIPDNYYSFGESNAGSGVETDMSNTR